jgi:ABC-type hemin transport system substrate-binding protein
VEARLASGNSHRLLMARTGLQPMASRGLVPLRKRTSQISALVPPMTLSGPGRPKRMVSLIASATEIICALGARDLLVGRSHECDFRWT